MKFKRENIMAVYQPIENLAWNSIMHLKICSIEKI